MIPETWNQFITSTSKNLFGKTSKFIEFCKMTDGAEYDFVEIDVWSLLIYDMTKFVIHIHSKPLPAINLEISQIMDTSIICHISQVLFSPILEKCASETQTTFTLVISCLRFQELGNCFEIVLIFVYLYLRTLDNIHFKN